MSLHPVFPGVVDERGKLTLGDRDAFLGYAATFAGHDVVVTVKRKRSKRSNQANSFYWSVVIGLLAEFCGYEPEEMHETMALRFLRIDDCPVTGSPRRRRTPDLSVQEFSEYVDKCVRFAAELGVVIPEPDAVEVA